MGGAGFGANTSCEVLLLRLPLRKFLVSKRTELCGILWRWLPPLFRADCSFCAGEGLQRLKCSYPERDRIELRPGPHSSSTQSIDINVQDKPLYLWRQFLQSSSHSTPSDVSIRSSGAAASDFSSVCSRSHYCTLPCLHPGSYELLGSCGSGDRKGKNREGMRNTSFGQEWNS